MLRRTGRERRVAAANRDKFSFSYFLWVVLIFLLFASGADLDRIFKLYLLLVPLVFIPALAVLVLWTMALMRNVALRRWRRVISVLVAPVAACALFVVADAAGVNSERIRLEIGSNTTSMKSQSLRKPMNPASSYLIGARPAERASTA